MTPGGKKQDINNLLSLVDEFSSWLELSLNTAKCGCLSQQQQWREICGRILPGIPPREHPIPEVGGLLYLNTRTPPIPLTPPLSTELRQPQDKSLTYNSYKRCLLHTNIVIHVIKREKLSPIKGWAYRGNPWRGRSKLHSTGLCPS